MLCTVKGCTVRCVLTIQATTHPICVPLLSLGGCITWILCRMAGFRHSGPAVHHRCLLGESGGHLFSIPTTSWCTRLTQPPAHITYFPCPFSLVTPPTLNCELVVCTTWSIQHWGTPCSACLTRSLRLLMSWFRAYFLPETGLGLFRSDGSISPFRPLRRRCIRE